MRRSSSVYRHNDAYTSDAPTEKLDASYNTKLFGGDHLIWHHRWPGTNTTSLDVAHAEVAAVVHGMFVVHSLVANF